MLESFIRNLWGRYQLRRRAACSPLRIVVGASGRYEPGWVGTDAAYLDLLRPEQWARYFQTGTLDAILAEHVWEHLSPAEGLAAAQLCYRYLKPGGYLRVAVPDGFHPDPDYIDRVRVGGTGPGADDHEVLYTHESLAELFRRAGYSVRLLEYFDSSGQFHFTEWDADAGKIYRSSRFDTRNANRPLAYTSLILDAVKPTG